MILDSQFLVDFLLQYITSSSHYSQLAAKDYTPFPLIVTEHFTNTGGGEISFAYEKPFAPTENIPPPLQ